MTPQERLDASWAVFELAGDTVEATWTPAGGDAVPGTVIFDAPGVNLLSGVVAVNRSAVYRTAQWPTVRRADAITIDGTTYRSDEPMPLEDGLIARVELTKL